ncbi:MAG TPA: hypothetical protein DD473_03065 [Planctomycetaceae bacterium]|nr:hypothetical protein [Planctomycetaceae bacterium]
MWSFSTNKRKIDLCKHRNVYPLRFLQNWYKAMTGSTVRLSITANAKPLKTQIMNFEGGLCP